MSKPRSPWIPCVLIALSQVAVGAADDAPANNPLISDTPAGETPEGEIQPTEFRTENVRGKVVWLGEALQEHFHISTVPESRQRALAIFTEQGELWPLVEDVRGRAFRKDERLRGKPMELVVRRSDKHPLLQIIRVYEFRDGKKYEVDYWCDVCAITMFEKGLCACCQDENRLRYRLVD